MNKNNQKSEGKYDQYPLEVRKFLDPTLCLLYDDKFTKNEAEVSIIKETVSRNDRIAFFYLRFYSLLF